MEERERKIERWRKVRKRYRDGGKGEKGIVMEERERKVYIVMEKRERKV
jgi:hypothetical protein